MSYTSWAPLYRIQNVDEAVAAFYNTVYELFDTCIPKKVRSKSIQRRYPVWFTGDIIYSIKQKAFLHRKWKQSKNPDTYQQFSKIRAEIKTEVSVRYQEYTNTIVANINSNPRAFWRHVNNLRTKGGFTPTVTHEGSECVGEAAAAAFATFFSSVFLPDAPALDAGNINCGDRTTTANYINVSHFTECDVLRALRKLKPKSSIGPDNIPPYVLKACSDVLLAPLCHMFNLVLSSGQYPSMWKLSRVSPIPKTSDHTCVENYRPIAILSSLAKLFESILHTKLCPQLRPYLSDAQHGFRSQRSTNTNLLTLVDTISRHMDKASQVDVAYFDFKKAFDRVDNDVLLGKLCAIGFAPKLLTLFAGYLRDRKQYVKYGCFTSDPYHTRSGVSQGSILGPMLFIIMVNDLETVLNNATCLLYADDLKLVLGIKREADCELLHRDLDAVYAWSQQNKLNFNSSKCYVMSFTRARQIHQAPYSLGPETIARVNLMKDLGVLFDPSLTFHEHMVALSADCMKRLGFILRTSREFHNPKAVQLLYTALVRTKIESGAVVWNPHEAKYTLMLEKVQKAFLRSLYKKKYGYYPFMYPTLFLCGMLGFNMLKVRRDCEQLVTVCRIIRGEYDCPALTQAACRLNAPGQYLRARRHDLLSVPVVRTVARKHSPIIRALTSLNAMVTSAPDCDLFADGLVTVADECLRYCERNE